MADTTPRYPQGTRRFPEPPEAGHQNDAARSPGELAPGELAPEELATRKWMLIIGGVGVLALAVAAVSSFAFGRDASAPAPAAVSIGPGSTVAASSTAGGTAVESESAAKLAEARSTMAALEGQLQAAQERADGLDRLVGANEQVRRITVSRAETAEVALDEQRVERAEFQADLDAINSALTEANAERAALHARLGEAERQAAASDARAASLATSVEALRGCLGVHQQALYYSTLDNWGLLATAMQESAVSCYQELG